MSCVHILDYRNKSVPLCGYEKQSEDEGVMHGGMTTATCLGCIAVYQSAADIGLSLLHCDGLLFHIVEELRAREVRAAVAEKKAGGETAGLTSALREHV